MSNGSQAIKFTSRPLLVYTSFCAARRRGQALVPSHWSGAPASDGAHTAAHEKARQGLGMLATGEAKMARY